MRDKKIINRERFNKIIPPKIWTNHFLTLDKQIIIDHAVY